MKDQKELVREINERKIIEAAEQVFARYGFKGATTDQISKQSGLPKANIHYYFKTKANLYHQVLAGILNEWMESAQAFDNQEEPKQALTQYVESKMEFSRKRPFASKVWANEMLHGAPVVSEFLETTLKNWLDDRVQVIQNWVESGKINSVDPMVFIYMIWSVTQHYADFERQIVLLNHGKEFTDEEFSEKTQQVVNLILTSVGV
ncbi:MAG: TetR family transcriptional regulator [Gammaproteobacteria bacterium]|nr:MAG: TetR family transcriptional regulator [Gammaproteobacteria bacterium]